MATTAKRRDSARPTRTTAATEQQPTASQKAKKPKTPSSTSRNGRIRWLSPEEGRKHFDRAVRKRLGISGEEFLRRLDAGEYRDIPDDPEHWPIIELSMMTALPARAPSQAAQEVAELLQRAVSCGTRSVLSGTGQRRGQSTYDLELAGGRRVLLAGAHRLLVRLRYRLEVVEQLERPGWWEATTVGYWYECLHADERELLAYHWHPGGASPITWPHIHVSGPTVPIDMTRGHLPTGPVALPVVLRYAIADLGVRPLRADWQRVLAEAERALAAPAE